MAAESEEKAARKHLKDCIEEYQNKINKLFNEFHRQGTLMHPQIKRIEEYQEKIEKILADFKAIGVEPKEPIDPIYLKCSEEKIQGYFTNIIHQKPQTQTLTTRPSDFFPVGPHMRVPPSSKQANLSVKPKPSAPVSESGCCVLM